MKQDYKEYEEKIKMNDNLKFDAERGETRTYEAAGKKITCRAYLGIVYCERPADPVQKLNIFVPEAYGQGGTVCGYTKDTAPIFIPNTVGGYLPGPADEPGLNIRTGMPNSIFTALEHGCVVVSGGVRGRTSGKRNSEFFEGGKTDDTGQYDGKMVGKAPALIVDMKAVIRYIRHNRSLIPGDTERIITSGTSAGGALSALAGAAGNSQDYVPYLKEIGAADERDDVFAANCYCPIHNLENADAAYEWQFGGIRDYYRTRHQKTENGIIRIPEEGTMTDRQMELSQELQNRFPAYLNSLNLKDENGNSLKLDNNGEGSFLEYIKGQILKSASRELAFHGTASHLSGLAAPGSAVDTFPALTILGESAVGLDWKAYMKAITRMKPAPAFDAIDLKSPENEEFGSMEMEARHFSEFSMEHTETEAEMAPAQLIRMLNPTQYIGNADTAKHWRIRHGSFDRDTSFAIPVILALLLENKGYDVDFLLPWGLPHSGDYDLQELFAWIDTICGQQ